MLAGESVQSRSSYDPILSKTHAHLRDAGFQNRIVVRAGVTIELQLVHRRQPRSLPSHTRLDETREKGGRLQLTFDLEWLAAANGPNDTR
jgi:hypothetical protein